MLYIKYAEIRIIFAGLFLSLIVMEHMDTKMVKNRQRIQFKLAHHQEKLGSHTCSHLVKEANRCVRC